MKQYGPINRFSTIFEPLIKGHPDYIAQPDSYPNKQFSLNNDTPNPIFYVDHFGELWCTWTRRNCTKEAQLAKKKKRRAYHERNRQRNLALFKTKNKKLSSSKIRAYLVGQSTPCWLTPAERNEIKKLYETARLITEITNVLHSVDHIIPLRGDLVSGLHVPTNLRVIKNEEDLKKGNKFEVV